MATRLSLARGPIPESLVEKNSLTSKISVIDPIANAFPRKFVSQRNLERISKLILQEIFKRFRKVVCKGIEQSYSFPAGF